MDIGDLVKWLKRIGLGSLFLFAVYAVLEEEIQRLWLEILKPYFIEQIPIIVSIPRYMVFLLILVVSAIVIWCFYAFLKLQNSKGHQGWRPFGKISLPGTIDETLTTADVISAVVAARDGQLEVEQMAQIVLSAAKFQIISVAKAAEFLGEFGYGLVKLPHGEYRLIPNVGEEVGL